MLSLVIVAISITTLSAHAEMPKAPPTAEVLPEFDMLCYRSYSVVTMRGVPGVIINRDYFGTPRFELKSVEGTALKLIFYSANIQVIERA